MRIGELAQASAVSRDTLRFYEQRGLIAAQRSANGYRDYPADMVQLVQYIKTAQRLGFTLGEIGHSVAAHLAVAGSGQCRHTIAARQAQTDRSPHGRTGRIARRVATTARTSLSIESMIPELSRKPHMSTANRTDHRRLPGPGPRPGENPAGRRLASHRHRAQSAKRRGPARRWARCGSKNSTWTISKR